MFLVCRTRFEYDDYYFLNKIFELRQIEKLTVGLLEPVVEIVKRTFLVPFSLGGDVVLLLTFHLVETLVVVLVGDYPSLMNHLASAWQLRLGLRLIVLLHSIYLCEVD